MSFSRSYETASSTNRIPEPIEFFMVLPPAFWQNAGGRTMKRHAISGPLLRSIQRRKRKLGGRYVLLAHQFFELGHNLRMIGSDIL